MTHPRRLSVTTAALAWLVLLTTEASITAHRLALAGCLAALLLVIGQAARGRRTNRPLLLAAAGSLLLALLLLAQTTRPAAEGAGAWRLAASIALLGATVVLAVCASPGRRGTAAPGGEGFAMLSAGTLLAVFLLLVTGAMVSGEGAGLACTGWPLCNGEVFPAGDRLAGINAFHRVAAASAGVLVAVLLWRTFAARPRNRALALTGVALAAVYAAQVLIGAGNVWLRLAEPVRIAHLAVAGLAWGMLVLMTTLAFRAARPAVLEPAGAVSPAARVLAYVNLMKPRIIELLLVTTVPAMVLAERGMPSLGLMLATIVGGTLTAGGANAINCYIDRDIDQVMKRTRRRALPGNRVAPERALAFGVIIGMAGFLLLAVLVNLLAAVLSISALLFYVFIYTLWLKRRYTQNIVIGGAAGAIPPLVGWAAVTGRVDLPALVLFLIILLWTPPHFWALAIKYREDYAAAGVPMLPVARGEATTRVQIFWYTLALVGSSVLLFLTGGAGLLYLAAAVLLGAWITRMAVQMLRQGDQFPVMKLFTFSITYLGLLFAAMIADQAARSVL